MFVHTLYIPGSWVVLPLPVNMYCFILKHTQVRSSVYCWRRFTIHIEFKKTVGAVLLVERDVIREALARVASMARCGP